MGFGRFFQKLRTLIDGAWFEEAARLIHRFGGAAANIGAFALARAIREFGENIETRDFTGLQNEMEKFMEEAERVIKSQS